MYTIPSIFNDFIAPDCNRAAFIQNYLNAAGLEAPILQMEGKNHIYVKFPQSHYNPMFRIKTVIAHYDRVGIGANDNSAAVFCLMQWVVDLARIYSADCMAGSFHNIRLIFTDGEELGANNGIQEQGAFALAALFRRLAIADEDVFVFDCMGRGTIPIICQSHIPKSAAKSFITRFSQLEQRAEQVIKSASPNWLKLPTSYSDNAGFIANGIPAVAITMLPADEAEAYCRSLAALKMASTEKIRTNSIAVSSEKTGTSENPASSVKLALPPTWKMLHTQDDSIQNLTPQAFPIMQNILQKLAELKTIK